MQRGHGSWASCTRCPCARLLQYAFATDAESSARDRSALAVFREDHGVRPPAPEARYANLAFSGGTLRWESHAEFTAYLWRLDGIGDAPVQAFPPRPISSRG
jgi:uncharacterized membrane-anchored protein